jgi:hypothetical protein
MSITITSFIKVSVLASGDLLLEGRPTTLSELAQVMERAAKAKSAVWYYRENRQDPASPLAREVFRLITANKLPIRFSTKPDFSESLGMGDLFAEIREKAAQGIAILRPGGRGYLLFRAGNEESVPADKLASAERMLPSSVKQNVAVIADTTWTAKTSDAHVGLQAIPFLDLLMGFATLGHAVWIFDAKPAFLKDGCREADVLIVDSTRVASLPPDWPGIVAKVMRNPQILVHDRATYQFRKP